LYYLLEPEMATKELETDLKNDRTFE
jgi:hypothetical protein